MQSENPVARPSKMALWIGWMLTPLLVLFLLMDGVMKLFKPKFVVKATVELGIPQSDIVGIGIALLVCTLFYVVPRTAVLGAILLTGYLGGAIAIQVRIGAGAFSLSFPFIFCVLVWLALLLRESRLRALLPMRT